MTVIGLLVAGAGAVLLWLGVTGDDLAAVLRDVFAGAGR